MKTTMLCTNCSECQNKNKKTICVHNMFWEHFELGIYMHWTGNAMNNLLSYCGLLDAKIRTSGIDLPVMQGNSSTKKKYMITEYSSTNLKCYDFLTIGRWFGFPILFFNSGKCRHQLYKLAIIQSLTCDYIAMSTPLPASNYCW